MESNDKNSISNIVLPVKMNDRTIGTIGSYALWFPAAMVTTVMLAGIHFIPEVSFTTAITMILFGSIAGMIPVALIGEIGRKTGLVTMVAARATFGGKGANIPSALNIIILIGWHWAQTVLGGLALNYISAELIGINNPSLYIVLMEAIIIAIVLFAIRGIAIFERIAAICITLILAVVIIKVFSQTGIQNILDVKPVPVEGHGPMYVFDLSVASAISFVGMAADYNRNFKTSSVGGFMGTVIGWSLGGLLTMGTGAMMVCMVIANGIEPSYDLTELFSQIGLGIPGAIVVFMGIIAGNVMNLYSVTMSTLQIFPKLSYTKIVLVGGLICGLGALFSGILDIFMNFVNMIAVLFMPLFAIMIADFFILKKRMMNIDAVVCPEQHDDYTYFKGTNWIAIILFVVCAAICYYFSYINPLPTGATVPSFLLAMVVYVLVMKIAQKKNINL